MATLTRTPRPHKCDHTGCGAAFSTARLLKVHQRVHSGERPHRCHRPGCGAAFADPSSLRRHEIWHTGIRAFKCEHPGCGAAFFEKAALHNHERTHTGARPFRCSHPGCGAAFANQATLHIHQRTHTGARPYRCTHPGCGAAFAHSNTLKLHAITHTSQRPFACSVPGCGAAYADPTTLKRHLARHAGQRSFVCDQPGCGAAFVLKSDLVAHVRTHTGQRPFVCDQPGCGAAFAQSCNLATHKRARHTPEGIARQKKLEERVAKALKAAGIAFKREHVIDFRCVDTRETFARVDFVIHHRGHVVLLEVDERQHDDRPVACEVARMAKAVESLALGGNTLPLVIIRYNPHGFKVDGRRAHVKMYEREAELVKLISGADSPVYTGRPLAVAYMYYDRSAAGRPVVIDHDEYDARMRECVLTGVAPPTTQTHVDQTGAGPSNEGARGHSLQWRGEAAKPPSHHAGDAPATRQASLDTAP